MSTKRYPTICSISREPCCSLPELHRYSQVNSDSRASAAWWHPPRLGFPWPQTGARIPISWKRGFRGPKTPISTSPLQRLGKGVKRGIFWQKTPFSRTRGNGGFWTPKPSFCQEMGIRAPVWGQGIPTLRFSWWAFGRPPPPPENSSEKHINFFNINFLPPTQNTRF